MDLNNLVNRVIVPSLTRCGDCRRHNPDHVLADHDFTQDESLPQWHGWQAARRRLGTNLYRLGVLEKTIQAILRHANVSTPARITSKLSLRMHKLRWRNLKQSLLDNKWITAVALGSSRIPFGG
jgi:hypothetical protein